MDRLRKDLTDRDGQRRYRAAWALGRIRPAAEDAVLEALRSGDDRARGSAVQALGWMGTSLSPAAVNALVKALGDRDDEVKRWSAEALGELSRQIQSKLVAALSDPRLACARAPRLRWLEADLPTRPQRPLCFD